MPSNPNIEGSDRCREILIRGAGSVGLNLLPVQVEAFLSYLSLLVSWNSRLSLTSIRDPALITRLHFVDSLAVARFLSPTARIMDVGSGAGFPGIPLKIALPAKEVVLVESRRRKANFLREVVRGLRLGGIEVVEDRFEQLSAENIGLFDEMIARAIGSPEAFLRYSAPLLCAAGKCWIMHGPKGIELFGALGSRSERFGLRAVKAHSYSLPFGQERRTLLGFQKK